ncbi:MAG: hypothetical protein NUV74_09045 [Candidatus Brocadiaceae bacterium]|nr:hypothetical protein [Candidatus Brocadiaceae bacterium]
MSKDKRIFDLEERLVDFAVRIIRTAESLPKTRAGNHIAWQLIRAVRHPLPIMVKLKVQNLVLTLYTR